MLTRRGGRTELRLNGAPVGTPTQPHAGFVTAVDRAFQWKNEILAGKVSTNQALAQREGLTRRYIMRVLRLSFLPHPVHRPGPTISFKQPDAN